MYFIQDCQPRLGSRLEHLIVFSGFVDRGEIGTGMKFGMNRFGTRVL
jgi:hypothetical protein